MSKTYPIRFSMPAMEDLEKISDELEQVRGSDFAKQYVDGLRRRIRTLRTSPRRYRARRSLGRGRRLMPERPYHIVFRIEEDHVLVLRIVHGRRNITRQMIDETDH